MSTLNYDRILSQFNVPVVQERNYWLVRTDGGIHYDDFIINGYIAIGWDYISKDLFEKKTKTEIKSLIRNQEQVAPTQDDDEDEESQERGLNGRVTAIYNKLDRFINEFSVGDVVIIPSKNADRISIGVISSDIFEDPNYVSNYLAENPTTDIGLCSYKKRRKIKWIRGIDKKRIDVYLIKAFSSHHAISDVNEYADYINRELYSVYRTGDSIHSIIRAGHPKGLSFTELKSLIMLLESSMNEISIATGIPCDLSQLQVKLNIHSPGIIEFVCDIATCGVVIATTMLAWNHLRNGGKLKINLKIKDCVDFSVEAETLGTAGRENEALALKNDHKIKELTLSNAQAVRELNHRLDMSLPQIDLNTDALNIESEHPVEEPR